MHGVLPHLRGGGGRIFYINVNLGGGSFDMVGGGAVCGATGSEEGEEGGLYLPQLSYVLTIDILFIIYQRNHILIYVVYMFVYLFSLNINQLTNW